MNKLNKKLVSTMIMFIVLMLSNVYATGSTKIAGNGTEDNPYIVDVSTASAKKITFEYNSLPFYFKVKAAGTYEVNHNPTNSEVTFMLIESPNSSTNILLDESTYNDIKNWQVGVAPRLGDSANVSVPTYTIYENLEFISDEITATNFGGTTSAASGYLPATGYRLINRLTKLHNVTVPGNVAASRSNLFFFVDETQKNLVDLIEPLGYELNSRYNDNLAFYDYYEINGNIQTQLGIPNATNGSDSEAKILYRFDGSTNTALNATASDTNSIEAILTRIFMWLGDDLLLNMLKKTDILDETLTIDALIFNRFEDTKLDLYNENTTGINKALRDVVNNWYKIFLVITYIIYIIILVYIGIMIVLSAGTEKQSKAKSYLGNWVAGLVILLFLPTYGIPLIFKLNDALVTFVGSNSSRMETYYNSYNMDNLQDILGSDSATITIEELTAIRAEIETEYNELSEDSRNVMNSIKADISGLIAKEVGDEFYNSADAYYLNNMLYSLYYNYENRLDNLNETHEEAKNNIKNELIETIERDYNTGFITSELHYILNDILFSSGRYDALFDGTTSQYGAVLGGYKDMYEKDNALEIIDHNIQVMKNDLMGTMRAYAGKYQRLIFVFIWYMLLFQLIGLAFLYYKRIFVIAILIAIFPLIMLSYCIDKMADGSAQTFSLWLKELLANVFIQTVHAIIYTVLVEMGLNVYTNDPGNWILLLASMLFIIPAEGILKEVFELNGSTLRALSNSAMKTATAVGSLVALSKSGKSSRDESLKKKNDKRVKNLQKSQNRADTKAKIREAERARNPSRPINGFGKFREGVYHGATSARKAVAKAAPHVDQALRVARNTAAFTAGALYAVAGGDAESMAQGAAIATALSGKGKKLSKKDMNLKTEISSAYKRKNKKKP